MFREVLSGKKTVVLIARGAAVVARVRPLGWAMVHSFQYNPNLVSGKALCRCGQQLPSQFILSKADDP